MRMAPQRHRARRLGLEQGCGAVGALSWAAHPKPHGRVCSPWPPLRCQPGPALSCFQVVNHAFPLPLSPCNRVLWFVWLKGRKMEQSVGFSEGAGTPLLCSPGASSLPMLCSRFALVFSTLHCHLFPLLPCAEEQAASLGSAKRDGGTWDCHPPATPSSYSLMAPGCKQWGHCSSHNTPQGSSLQQPHGKGAPTARSSPKAAPRCGWHNGDPPHRQSHTNTFPTSPSLGKHRLPAMPSARCSPASHQLLIKAPCQTRAE